MTMIRQAVQCEDRPPFWRVEETKGYVVKVSVLAKAESVRMHN